MSGIYSRRDEPAYGEPEARRVYAETPGILAWWRPQYDEVINSAIEELLWYWTCEISGRLESAVPEGELQRWIETDKLCETFAWYNVLTRFTESRAILSGWTGSIPRARRKSCLLCSEKFLETSLPWPLARRLDVRYLDFCAPCLVPCVFESAANAMTSDEIIGYLRRVSQSIGRPPRQGFGEGVNDLAPFKAEKRTELLKILSTRPSVVSVKEQFGSWRNAILAAGLK